MAALRAAGTTERDPAVWNPDYLAVRFLSRWLYAVSRFRPLVRLVVKLYERRLPGGYNFHIARTKHLDAVLFQCLRQGVRQVVVLGAGYDTRAYRFRELLAGVTVFELDRPATQEVKRQRVIEVLGRPLHNVVYIPIDFNKQRLGARLLGAGFSPQLPTLFIWEGVCMYLTPEAVETTLAFIALGSGEGSSVVFDYIFKPMVEGKCSYYGAKESAREAAKRGEPYLFGIEEGAVEEFLRARGFRVLSKFGPELLEQTYLRKSDGQILGKVYGYTEIVHAMVEPRQ